MVIKKMPQYASLALLRLMPLATPLHAAHAQVAAHDAAHAPRLVTTNIAADGAPFCGVYYSHKPGNLRCWGRLLASSRASTVPESVRVRCSEVHEVPLFDRRQLGMDRRCPLSRIHT